MTIDKLIIPDPDYLVAERFAKDARFNSKDKMERWLLSAREKQYFNQKREEQIRQICNKTNNKRKWNALLNAYDSASNKHQTKQKRKHMTQFYINLAEEFSNKPLQKSITDFIWTSYLKTTFEQ